MSDTFGSSLPSAFRSTRAAWPVSACTPRSPAAIISVASRAYSDRKAGLSRTHERTVRSGTPTARAALRRSAQRISAASTVA